MPPQRLKTPLDWMNCPSRRPPALYPSSNRQPNCGVCNLTAHGDYAANAGDEGNPETYYTHAYNIDCTGVSFEKSLITRQASAMA